MMKQHNSPHSRWDFRQKPKSKMHKSMTSPRKRLGILQENILTNQIDGGGTEVTTRRTGMIRKLKFCWKHIVLLPAAGKTHR